MSKAIVNSGNRRLIGEILEDKDDVQPGDNIVVQAALELRCDMFLLPTPQGPVGIQKTTIIPVDAEEDAVDILVKVDNIRWFGDMADRGQKYENMISEFKDILVQNRAQRAGLTIARDVPKPQERGSGLIL